MASKVEDLDLHKMSLEELQELRSRLDTTIQDYERRRKMEAKAEMKRIAGEFGFSIDEILGFSEKGKKAPAQKAKLPPKFANPNDPSETWSGRGRRPQWFLDAIEAGKSEDDLLIAA